jgi:predicted enzyme related to lactoylglutathione lyase
MANRSIVHVEFSTKDAPSSAKFYSELFGWEMHEMPEFNYWTFATGPEQGGGFNNIGDNAGGGFEVKPGTVVSYVTSEDIDADLAKAESLGGTTKAPKMEIPGIGWYGVFEDPSGNLVGLYTGMPRPAEG